MLPIEALKQAWSKTGRLRPFYKTMTMTDAGIVLGADTVLSNIDNEGDDDTREGLVALLATSFGSATSPNLLKSLDRAQWHWSQDRKCEAQIHLALTGMPALDEAGAYRLFMAKGLLEAGLGPRDLIEALDTDFDPSALFKSGHENQPRVPAGQSTGGQWTADGSNAGNADYEATSEPEGRNDGGFMTASFFQPKYTVTDELPSDAVKVLGPDGKPIDDPTSPTGKLMAPPRADFRQAYAAGQVIVNVKPPADLIFINSAIGQEGYFDYQRDVKSLTFYRKYKHASNYGVGVYMAGAGYSLDATIGYLKTYQSIFSSNNASESAQRIEWATKGWNDAMKGTWKR